MIDIAKLLVTHNELRHSDSLPGMVDYVRHAGYWTPNDLKAYAEKHGLERTSPLIQITEFEDGAQYVHDGHHRSVATFLGDRQQLVDEEYIVSHWTYAEYLEISHFAGWYTPFDPRTHVRSPDFNAFKRQARQRFEAGEDPEVICKWILSSGGVYLQERTLKTVAELASHVVAKYHPQLLSA